MAIRKKVVAVGGTSKGLILSKDAQELLGLSGGNDIVRLEFIGDTMLVRRDDAPPLTPAQLEAGLAGLENTAPADALGETIQRILLLLRERGPLTAAAVAEIIGRSREGTSKTLARLAREGVLVKTGEGYVLANPAPEA